MTRHQLYAGTYTQPEPHAPDAHGLGIHALTFDSTTGELEHHGVAARLTNPSFLAVHPNGRALYAISEAERGQVSAFTIAEDASLTPLNSQSTEGSATAHVSVDPHGRYVLVANYGGKPSVLAFPIQEGGALGSRVASHHHEGHGPNAERQDGSHAHCIRSEARGRHAYACDLGTDEIVTYDLTSPHGPLQRAGAARLPGGSGPRHIAIHPRGTLAFVTLELSSQLAVLERTADTGELHLRQVLRAHPTGYAGENAPAEVAVDASGAHVYYTNRGHDSVTHCQVHPTGELELIAHHPTLGRTPRHFTLSPDGRHLLVANQDSSSITVYARDEQAGHLTMTGQFECPTPTCLLFVPS